LQALDLLNDPIFVEAARALAQSTLKKGGTRLRGRIDWAFLQALDRKPTPAERQILVALHQKSLAEFAARPETARTFIHVGESPIDGNLRSNDLAAMTVVARAILNLHETITRN
jgi:hypothetical protein